MLRLLTIVKVLCIENDTIEQAMNSNFKDKEDAILYYGALDKKIDYFITRNKKDFEKFSIKQLTVLTPKELLSKLKA